MRKAGYIGFRSEGLSCGGGAAHDSRAPKNMPGVLCYKSPFVYWAREPPASIVFLFGNIEPVLPLSVVYQFILIELFQKHCRL